MTLVTSWRNSMFQKRPSPLPPICPKVKPRKEVSESLFVETDDVRIEKSKGMEIEDVELIIDEEVGIKTESVDDEYNAQTNVVKKRTRPPVNRISQKQKDIKIIQIGTESNKILTSRKIVKYFIDECLKR